MKNQLSNQQKVAVLFLLCISLSSLVFVYMYIEKAKDVVFLTQEKNELESYIASLETQPKPEKTKESTLVLPKIYIQESAYLTEKEKTQLQTNLIDPYVSYQKSQGVTVVSITINPEKANEYHEQDYVIFSAILSSNNEDPQAQYNGFIHEKHGDDFPVWVPERVPDGYQG